jgi:hypothetical protein
VLTIAAGMLYFNQGGQMRKTRREIIAIAVRYNIPMEVIALGPFKESQRLNEDCDYCQHGAEFAPCVCGQAYREHGGEA